jgi:hypothetical protein
MMPSEHSRHLKMLSSIFTVRTDVSIGIVGALLGLWAYLGILDVRFRSPLAFVIVGVVLSCLAVIATLLTDVLRRAAAKDKFARILSQYDPWVLKEMKVLIDQDSPTPYFDLWLLPDYPHQREFSKIGYMLRSLLREKPWGPIAAQALFQRSRVGRVRYFEQAAQRYSAHAGDSSSDNLNADENELP